MVLRNHRSIPPFLRIHPFVGVTLTQIETICKNKEKAKPRTRVKVRVVKPRPRPRAKQTQGTYVMVLRSASYLILGTIYATHGPSNIYSLHKVVRSPTRTRTRTNNRTNKSDRRNKIIKIAILKVSSLGRHLHKTDGVVVTVHMHPSNKSNKKRILILIPMGNSLSRHLHKKDGAVVRVVMSMQDRNARRRRA